MSMLWHWGDTNPIPFRLIDSNGDAVTGHTFVANDLFWSGWNGSTWSTPAADGTNVAEIGRGFYAWTPATAKTQYDLLVIDIVDSVGAAFLDNALVLQLGSNSGNGYFDGS